MKKMRKPTLLWLSSGILLGLLVLLITFSGLAGNVWVTDSAGIADTTNTAMQCIQSNDWTSLEQLISGSLSLSPRTGEAATAEHLIWNCYCQSLQWDCEEGFEVRGPYVIQHITITCLDISCVTDRMRQILPEMPAEEESVNHAEILQMAAEQALGIQPPVMEKKIKFTFTRENGSWKMIPDDALLSLLSGFTVS